MNGIKIVNEVSVGGGGGGGVGYNTKHSSSTECKREMFIVCLLRNAQVSVFQLVCFLPEWRVSVERVYV